MDNERLLFLAGVSDPLQVALRENIKELEEFANRFPEVLNEEVNMEGATIEDLQRMLDAAKRGLGIANRLRDPEYKKQHLSRMMGNLNRIRGGLARMVRQMDTDINQT